MIRNSKFLLSYRIFAVLVSLFGMGYRLVYAPLTDGGWMKFLNTLGYFTIQAGLMVLFVFISLLINQLRGKPEKALSYKIRGAVLLYSIVTSLLFWMIFSHHMHETGLSFFVFYINNLVTAVLLLIDNILTVPRQSYKWSDLLYWLIYPFAYLFFCIFESLVFGHFRYFIFDFSKYGIGFYFLITLELLAIFCLIGGFIIFINKSYNNHNNNDSGTVV